MDKDRVILHCDCNSFFASVETLNYPELRFVPMAVCGDPENRHGIILAKNEQAKAFGVKTAETIWQARKKCPELVLVPSHHEQYEEISKKVNEIYYRFTDLCEPFGIDETWLDVTGTMHLFGDGKTIADKIRETVKKEIGITVSVGVSFNKVYAKLGSDYKKPDATTVIDRENYKKIVFPLPVNDLLFVGKTTAQVLSKLNITTIGELANADAQLLRKNLGKMGDSLRESARGEDASPVRAATEKREIKSVGNGMTFKRDIAGIDEIKTGLMTLSDTVAERMRRYGVKCSTVCVTIKDPYLKSITRQIPLDHPTNLSLEIFDAAVRIMHQSWSMEKPIRMLTVTGSNLIDAHEQVYQISLTGDEKSSEKTEKLENAMDSIRRKFGKESVRFATAMSNDITAEE